MGIGKIMLTKEKQQQLESSKGLASLLTLAQFFRSPEGKLDVKEMISHDPYIHFSVKPFKPETNQERNLDAYVLVKTDKDENDRNNGVIGYRDETENDNSYLFYCLHEYLHRLLEYEKDKEFIRFRARKGVSIRSEFEEILDYLTAAIMMPQDLFKKDFNEFNSNNNSSSNVKQDFINSMGKKYGVIEESVSKRMKELELSFS